MGSAKLAARRSGGLCGEADLDEGAFTFDIWNSRTDHGGLYKRSYISTYQSIHGSASPCNNSQYLFTLQLRKYIESDVDLLGLGLVFEAKFNLSMHTINCHVQSPALAMGLKNNAEKN